MVLWLIIRSGLCDATQQDMHHAQGRKVLSLAQHAQDLAQHAKQGLRASMSTTLSEHRYTLDNIDSGNARLWMLATGDTLVICPLLSLLVHTFLPACQTSLHLRL